MGWGWEIAGFLWVSKYLFSQNPLCLDMVSSLHSVEPTDYSLWDLGYGHVPCSES